MALLLIAPVKSVFTITAIGQTGSALNTQTCNIQTTLDFQFSSNSIITSATTSSGLSNSYFLFLDRFGNDLNLTLSQFAFETLGLISFVSGYSTTLTAAALFQFVNSTGTESVYVYVPFVTGKPASSNTFVDLVDLTTAGSQIQLPSNTLQNLNVNSPLSAFNFFDNTDFNQWYTSVSGTNTVLVSKFVYNINSISGASGSNSSGLTTPFLAIPWNSTISSTGDKLCYASLSTGNFQTHVREIVALWFVWWGILIYWLIYLISDATNRNIYNKDKYLDNAWTCWSMYSITHLAHE